MANRALGALGALVLTTSVSVAPAVASPQSPSTSTQGASATAAVPVERLAGPDRYATAAQIAQQWSGPVERAYVVSGTNFHDALIAAARAGVYDAPVLLTKSGSLPNATAQQLDRLDPTTITVIGNSSAVSQSVLAQLDTLAGSGGVERVAGSNRYSTSAAVAARYGAGPDRVILASGEAYPDALSGAALAGIESQPLMLTERDSLPAQVSTQLARLQPAEVVIIGGPDAVSDDVLAQAASFTTSGDARRLSGLDRYDTAAAVAQEFPSDVNATYVASGQTYPDALVVSALASREHTAVVLTPTNKAAEGTFDALDHLAPNQVFVAGGPVAVSDTVVEQIADAGAPPQDPGPDPEFPDETSTGVPDGVQLSPSGSLDITQDGTVIDGLHVTGTIHVQADNVIIRNTLVQGGGNGYPIRVRSSATNALIEDVEVDNLNDTGIGIFITGDGATVRRANIHSAEDGVRIQADDVLFEDSYVHDLHREAGGHHDSIQIRNGDNITIRGNNLQTYVESIDNPLNAAIQIGSLVGDNQISNLLVTENLMNGGNFTVNGGGRWEVDSALYSYNRFGRDFRYGVKGNLQNSTWEDTNVWHDTGEPAH